MSQKFSSRDELLSLLISEETPDSSRLRRVAQLIEPAVAIDLVGPARPDPVGSRYGGEPYAPRGFVWPRRKEGQHSLFLGQVNFAEIAKRSSPSLERLPSSGVLQLFWDGYHSLASVNAGVHVCWHPNATAEQHISGMTHASDEKPFTPTSIEFASTFSAPSIWALLPELYPLQYPNRRIREWLSDDEWDEQFGYQCCVEGNGGGHQLLGHACAYQNDPRWEMAFGADQRLGVALEDDWVRWRTAREAGLTYDDEGHVAEASLARLWQNWVSENPVGAALEAERERWRLLWQVDADERLGLHLGDLGRLFVMIREDDLARGAFEAATTCWQAH
jgi:uncharacterized protein YwqG